MLEDPYYQQEARVIVLMKIVWCRRSVLTDEMPKVSGWGTVLPFGWLRLRPECDEFLKLVQRMDSVAFGLLAGAKSDWESYLDVIIIFLSTARIW